MYFINVLFYYRSSALPFCFSYNCYVAVFPCYYQTQKRIALIGLFMFADDGILNATMAKG